MELGYTLSSEEHGPRELVRFAQRAEEAGFSFASISDHFHPWIDEQGQSPYAWSVLGGIAATTSRIRVQTGVTCPFRYHPALIAQAAATVQAMFGGRFILGVGSGEALNEHVLAIRWPSVDVRQEMLEEAIEVMRELWHGELTSHYGRHWNVEDARIYTLPEHPVPVYVAASGKAAARMAGRVGDGLISTTPAPELVQTFEEAGGRGKPRVAQVHVCWASDEASARRTAHRVWPNAAVSAGTVDLPLPRDFAGLAESITEDQVAKKIVCGPDPERHVQEIRKYEQAGFSHVYVHQVGPDQEGFFDFYAREVMPLLTPVGVAGG